MLTEQPRLSYNDIHMFLVYVVDLNSRGSSEDMCMHMMSLWNKWPLHGMMSNFL